MHSETSPTRFCSALSSPFVLIIYLFERRAAPRPDLVSAGTLFWKASVLPTNPPLANLSVPTMPSGLRTSPSKFSERGYHLNRSGRREKTVLIYDKGFPIEEVFSEGIGGGKRTLPLHHFDSVNLLLPEISVNVPWVSDLRWHLFFKATAHTRTPPSAVFISRRRMDRRHPSGRRWAAETRRTALRKGRSRRRDPELPRPGEGWTWPGRDGTCSAPPPAAQ